MTAARVVSRSMSSREWMSVKVWFCIGAFRQADIVSIGYAERYYHKLDGSTCHENIWPQKRLVLIESQKEPLALQHIISRLEGFKPKQRWWRRWVKRSAVALILREQSGQIDVLMIKRADREGDPWSGHMAFPGGRMDRPDVTGLRTAMRETEEETGIILERAGYCIGRLSDIVSRPHSGRQPMVVTPYVFRLHIAVKIEPNHEVAEAVWVPLRFLMDGGNRESMTWGRGKLKITLPCYFYEKRRIWGMSLRMMDELLALI
jgi:8-oxo-dGTP pyrophosphatase MutT (NUDIX family)